MNDKKEKEPVLKAHRVGTVRIGTAKMGGTSRAGMAPKKKEGKAE